MSAFGSDSRFRVPCGAAALLRLLALRLSRLRRIQIRSDQSFQNLLRFCAPAEREITLREMHLETGLLGIILGQVFEQRQSIVGTATIQIVARQVVICFAYRAGHGFALIFAGRLDVTERNELLQYGLSRSGIHAQIAGMHSAFTGFLLPTRNASDLRRLFEGLHQHATIHVRAHWQSKERQDGWRHIQQSRSVDALVLLNVWSFHAEDPERPMLNRWTCRFCRDAARPQMIGMEAVIGHQQHSRVRTGQIPTAFPASCRESDKLRSPHLCKSRTDPLESLPCAADGNA